MAVPNQGKAQSQIFHVVNLSWLLHYWFLPENLGVNMSICKTRPLSSDRWPGSSCSCWYSWLQRWTAVIISVIICFSERVIQVRGILVMIAKTKNKKIEKTKHAYWETVLQVLQETNVPVPWNIFYRNPLSGKVVVMMSLGRVALGI